MFIRMNLGKHHGKCVQEVPTQYLEWALARCDCLDGWLRHAIVEELKSRTRGESHWNPHDTDPPPRHPSPVDWSAVITRWQRDLALKWHPDRGGDVKVMAALNDAADRLRKLVGVN